MGKRKKKQQQQQQQQEYNVIGVSDETKQGNEIIVTR
jgi:hypothetical protein